MMMMGGVVRQRCSRVGGWDEVMVRGDNLMVVMLTDLMVMIGDANNDHLRRVRTRTLMVPDSICFRYQTLCPKLQGLKLSRQG